MQGNLKKYEEVFGANKKAVRISGGPECFPIGFLVKVHSVQIGSFRRGECVGYRLKPLIDVELICCCAMRRAVELDVAQFGMLMSVFAVWLRLGDNSVYQRRS
jgi:hypothetical protein